MSLRIPNLDSRSDRQITNVFILLTHDRYRLGIKIDPKAKTAWVEGGTLGQDLDHETSFYGLATPIG